MDCSFEGAMIYQAGFCQMSLYFVITFTDFSINGHHFQSPCNLYFGEWLRCEIWLNDELKPHAGIQWLCLLEEVTHFEREDEQFFLGGVLANRMKIEVSFQHVNYALRPLENFQAGFELNKNTFPDWLAEDEQERRAEELENESDSDLELSIPRCPWKGNHIPDVAHSG